MRRAKREQDVHGWQGCQAQTDQHVVFRLPAANPILFGVLHETPRVQFEVIEPWGSCEVWECVPDNFWNIHS